MQPNRMQILEMIERGEITAAEGLRLLESIPEPSAAAGAAAQPAAPDPAIQKWKNWWLIPFWIGLGLTVIGALLIYSAYQTLGVGFGIFFASLPFALGVAVMAFSWWSKNARWLHVRVDTGKDKFPRYIAVSMPFPAQLVSLVLSLIPQRNVNASNKLRAVSEIFAMVDQGLNAETPLFVEVNEGKEKVQVYLG